MKIRLKIDVPINVTDHVTDIVFCDHIMVSLDCSGCKRCRRSVVIDTLEYLSYCTSTHHRFNGRVLEIRSSTKQIDRNQNITTGTYLIEYEYDAFQDEKYSTRVPSPDSNWARATFHIRCKCGINTKHEAQNNTVRPFDVACKCGAILFRETIEIPQIALEKKG